VGSDRIEAGRRWERSGLKKVGRRGNNGKEAARCRAPPGAWEAEAEAEAKRGVPHCGLNPAILSLHWRVHRLASAYNPSRAARAAVAALVALALGRVAAPGWWWRRHGKGIMRSPRTRVRSPDMPGCAPLPSGSQCPSLGDGMW
jgi:hypothetical protein